MLQAKTLTEYRLLVMRYIRDWERERAHADPDKLAQIEHSSDTYLIRKWLWMSSIVAAPVVYLIVPFVIHMLSFLPEILLVCLWLLAKGLMGIVFVLFITAIYVTVSPSFEETR
jgi:hypothetical protein